MKSFLLPFAAIAIAVAMPTQAQTTQRYDIASFDFAGVSLGMSPEAAREAMRKAGFDLTEKAFAVTQTFEGLVRSKAQELRQPIPQISSVDGPAEIEGRDSKGNKLPCISPLDRSLVEADPDPDRAAHRPAVRTSRGRFSRTLSSDQG